MLGTFPQTAPVWGPNPSSPLLFGDIDDFIFTGKGTSVAAIFGTTADASKYLVTLVNSANAIAIDNVRGGQVRLGVTGTNNDKVSVQENGTPFLLDTGKQLTFVARLQTSAIAGTALGVGVAAPATTLLTDTTFATTPADFIGFKSTDAAGTLICVVKAAGTETTVTTTKTLVNSTFKELAFQTTDANDGVTFWIDGIQVARIKVTLPLNTVGLARIVEGKAQASTAFNLDLDVLGCVQVR